MLNSQICLWCFFGFSPPPLRLHLKYLISAKLFVSGSNSYLDSLGQDLMMFVLNCGRGEKKQTQS